jgi:MFS family permease
VTAGSWRSRALASLRTSAYRRFFAGHVLSLLGFWMRIVAQGWLVYEITGSKAVLGAVTAAGLAPFVVLSPVGGILADRVDRRRLLMAAGATAAAANLAVGLLVLAGVVTIAHVVLAALVAGSARAVEIPVRNAYVRNLVAPEDLRNAIALNAAGFNVARVVGPALAAGVLALFGMGICFLVVAAFGATLLVSLRGLPSGKAEVLRARESPWKDLGEALAYVRGHRRTRTLLLVLALTLVFTWSYQTLMPAYAKDRFGTDESGFALLMALSGVGALAGALWVAGRAATLTSPRRTILGLLAVGALAVLGLGASRTLALSLALVPIGGFCQVAFMTTANGLVQEAVPDELTGRVMGLWAFVFGSAFPLGSLVMGWTAQSFGLSAAWIGGGALTLVLSVVAFLPARGPRPASASA